MQLILASGSERRNHLLSWLGIPFEVVVSEFDETLIKESDPEELVKKLALGKAKEVVERLKSPSTTWTRTESRRAQDDTRDEESVSHVSRLIVIGADTVVAINNEVIGKPKDERDAVRILKKLSGKTHAVYTGVAVIDAKTGKEVVDFEQTEVTFRKLSDNEIRDYVATGEPLDKGGAYAIQMGAAGFVGKVEGSYTNVVGLPLLLLEELLDSQGYTIEVDISGIIFNKTGYRS